ncbi:peptidoglycan-binding protein [Streptomyces sp. NPDC101225]|uniref:peptidoglycan-binding domain-containing protein n=1 Tax=Streptomyces sp. NPDC101225 TaxID=3366135 RepID=UPI003817E6B3
MSLRTKAITMAVAVTLGGGITLGASPALASPSGGVVHGKGNFRDDWNDEYVDASHHAHSNVAAMWQAILWADKKLSYSGIDCRFGPATAAATKKWQTTFHVRGGADGKVGRNTFGRASDFLSGSAGSSHQIKYTGMGGRYVTFKRADNGRWAMYLGNDLKTLWYNNATFNACR